MFYFYIITSVVLYLIGDYIAKVWVANEKWSLFIIIMPIYLVASIAFLFALKKVDSLSLALILTNLAVLASGVFIGHFFFAERLNTLQYFGFGFAVIAIILLTFPFSKSIVH